MPVKERQDFAADDRLLLSGLLNHWAAAICFSISCLNLKQRAARTKNKLSDLQQNQHKDLAFAKVCLWQWRHASQLSFIVWFFSSLFRANSTTDPRSTAGKELLFSRDFFPRNVFLEQRWFGCFQPCSAQPTAPATERTPHSSPGTLAPAPPPAGTALPGHEPTPLPSAAGTPPGTPGSAVGVPLRVQDSPIRPKLSDKVLRNFFILLIFSAECESIMSHMGGRRPPARQPPPPLSWLRGRQLPLRLRDSPIVPGSRRAQRDSAGPARERSPKPRRRLLLLPLGSPPPPPGSSLRPVPPPFPGLPRQRQTRRRGQGGEAAPGRDGGVEGKSGEGLRAPAEGGSEPAGEGGCAQRKEEAEPGRAWEPLSRPGGGGRPCPRWQPPEPSPRQPRGAPARPAPQPRPPRPSPGGGTGGYRGEAGGRGSGGGGVRGEGGESWAGRAEGCGLSPGASRAGGRCGSPRREPLGRGQHGRCLR